MRFAIQNFVIDETGNRRRIVNSRFERNEQTPAVSFDFAVGKFGVFE